MDLNKLNCFTAPAGRRLRTLAPLSCPLDRGLRVSPWVRSRLIQHQRHRRHRLRCLLPLPFRLQGSPWPLARSSVPGCSVHQPHTSVLRRSFGSLRLPYHHLCKIKYRGGKQQNELRKTRNSDIRQTTEARLHASQHSYTPQGIHRCYA